MLGWINKEVFCHSPNPTQFRIFPHSSVHFCLSEVWLSASMSLILNLFHSRALYTCWNPDITNCRMIGCTWSMYTIEMFNLNWVHNVIRTRGAPPLYHGRLSSQIPWGSHKRKIIFTLYSVHSLSLRAKLKQSMSMNKNYQCQWSCLLIRTSNMWMCVFCQSISIIF